MTTREEEIARMRRMIATMPTDSLRFRRGSVDEDLLSWRAKFDYYRDRWLAERDLIHDELARRERGM